MFSRDSVNSFFFFRCFCLWNEAPTQPHVCGSLHTASAVYTKECTKFYIALHIFLLTFIMYLGKYFARTDVRRVKLTTFTRSACSYATRAHFGPRNSEKFVQFREGIRRGSIYLSRGSIHVVSFLV